MFAVPGRVQGARLLGFLLVVAALGLPGGAWAQPTHEADFLAFEDSGKASHTGVRATDLHLTQVVPGRSLALATGTQEASAGVVVTSDKYWALPLSFAGGFGEGLELGADVAVVARPFDSHTLLSNLAVRGKYTLIKNELLLIGEFRMDGGVLNPVAHHVMVQVPYLVQLHPIVRLFAMATLSLDYPQFQLTAGSRFILNLTPMVHITPDLFASLDTQFAFGMTPDFQVPVSDTALPVGLGLGYLISANGAVRAVATMADVAPDKGVDRQFVFNLFYVTFLK